MESDNIAVEMTALVNASDAKINRITEGLKLAQCIKRFTNAMTVKVASHIDDRSGWNDEELAKVQNDALMNALRNGDYVSVANYAMFLDNLGYEPGRSAGE